MPSKYLKIRPGMRLWLVRQYVNTLESPYLVDAVVVAKDESSAIDRLVAYAKGMKWPWGCARLWEDVALDPDLLEATELGTTTAKGLECDRGVVTFRLGMDPKAIDGNLAY
jgi:hypothetical protein